jgi:diguanylate cyclase (GGDEF)-like protein/excisionase family DNA binding protein
VPQSGQTVSVAGAARILGVHANTVRAWTDQGRLPCLRINARGDRRYSIEELHAFLARAEQSPAASDAQLAMLIGRVAALCSEIDEPAVAGEAIAGLLCLRLGYDDALIVGASPKPSVVAGRGEVDWRLVERARRDYGPAFAAANGGRRTMALAIDREQGLVLQLRRPEPGRLGRPAEAAMLEAIAILVNAAATGHRLRRQGEDDARRAELLLSISRQIATQRDLPSVLSQLIDNAVELFEADHGAVFSRTPAGRFRADAQRNISPALRAAIEGATALPLTTYAYETRRVVSVTDYVADPRSLPLREALVREGINTVSIAPLVAGEELIGTLALYHDRPYEWRPRDRALLEQLAAQGAAALHNARLLARAQAWAAQLQSIQQLGVELNRLDDPREIGRVIAAELGTLIDYHNVRVYRVDGEDVVAVAWRGRIGEYADEDGDALRLTVGEGITGWVAEHGQAVNLGDAARDPRAQTIPGTEEDLDESMLVVPMLHEDRVIGVLVLSKLGLNEFSDDDQRLLEIFAAIAAAAMASADATVQLRRQSDALAHQLAGQRELLRVTESVLSTLDRNALLEEIADRLTTIIPVDNIAVELYHERSHALEPIFARGTHAEHFLAHPSVDSRGISGYVVQTGEATLLSDQLNDPRLEHFAVLAPRAGALIALPLRARDLTLGVLTVERLGEDAAFSDEEFELAKLFAGHVSIALRNADAHHAVEVRAQTDALTGLLNQGALIERLRTAGSSGLERYGLLMIDLDDFKGYNDRYGHQAGNALLQQLAVALREACRDSDEVYRYGGDEFAIVLPDTPPSGARSVAEKVRLAVAHASRDGRSPDGVTCSIGVATRPADGEDGAQLLLAADRACYVAKRAGRDRIATAAEGLALAGEFLPPPPTPVDGPEPAFAAA